MSWLDWIKGGATTTAAQRMTARELLEQVRLGQAPYIVDVREREELKGQLSLLPRAVNLPLSEFGKRFNEVPKDRRVALVCMSGNRSWQALKFLKSQGYTQVQNVDGGMLAVRTVQA